MEVIIDASGNEAVTSGSFIVEGSNDGTSYTPVSGTFTYGTNLSATAPVYGPGTRGYTFPFASNTDSYTHYRIFANSMNTRFGRRFYELHFNYSVFNPELDNISFGDNGTPGLFTDDVIDFDLNPSPGSGTYSVDITGHTVTPSIGTYGQVTSFQVSSGSAGIGDLELLVIDQNVPCVQPVTLTNPDLTGTLDSSHLACASPTDSPSGKLTLTGVDGVFTKADYSIGTSYTGTGYAGATAVSNVSSGFDLVTTLPNPTYTTYYTVRAYATETLYRDFVVSLDQKVCSVADLSLAVSPATDDANEGEQLTYVVTLTNAGPDPALNVDVKVDIPVGLQILSVSPSIGEYSAGTQLWSAELVPVGTHQLSVTYRMK